MINSFEELSDSTADKARAPQQFEPLFRPLIWAAVLVYVSVVVFLPFILTSSQFFGTLPLFFTGVFFAATVIFVASWLTWVLMIKRATGEVGPRLLLPLLAVPASVAFFYILALTLSLFS